MNLRSELSAQGLDAGPHTIAHLQQRHQITVSPSRSGAALLICLVEPNPKKRPRSS